VVCRVTGLLLLGGYGTGRGRSSRISGEKRIPGEGTL
jgi:hypothetical protein